MTNAELLDLLREAKRLIAANRLMLGHYSGVREVGSLEDSIDAALAERQDSATEVVESEGEKAWRHSWMQEREANGKLVALLRRARKVTADVVTDARSIAFAQWSPEQHRAEAVRDAIDALLAETDFGAKS